MGIELWCNYCIRDHQEDIDARPGEKPWDVVKRKCQVANAYGMKCKEDEPLRAWNLKELAEKLGHGYDTPDRNPPEGKYTPAVVEKTDDGQVKRYMVMKWVEGKGARWEMIYGAPLLWTAKAATEKAQQLGEGLRAKKMLIVQIAVPEK